MKLRKRNAPPVTTERQQRQGIGRLQANAASHRSGELGQERCSHPSLRRFEGRHHDYRICELCREVLDAMRADHHPEISRWLNEGGAIGR